MGLMKRSDIFTIYLQGRQKYGTQTNTNNFFMFGFCGYSSLRAKNDKVRPVLVKIISIASSAQKLPRVIHVQEGH